MADYPAELERKRYLFDGSEVLIRPIRADDKALEQDLVHRFFAPGVDVQVPDRGREDVAPAALPQEPQLLLRGLEALTQAVDGHALGVRRVGQVLEEPGPPRPERVQRL